MDVLFKRDSCQTKAVAWKGYLHQGTMQLWPMTWLCLTTKVLKMQTWEDCGNVLQNQKEMSLRSSDQQNIQKTKFYLTCLHYFSCIY